VNIDIRTLDPDRDYAEVDKFASGISGCSPFQTGSLARVYARSPDSQPTLITARDESGALRGTLMAVTFTHGPGPTSVARSLTAHTTVRGSPPTAVGHAGADILSTLASGLESHLPKGTLYVRCYPDHPSPFPGILEARGFEREDWLNFLVDLRSTPEELLGKMSKHRRKGIRIAEGQGIRIDEVTSRRQLGELYVLLQAAHRRLKIPLQRRELFEAVREQLVLQGRALLLLARRDGEAIAARVILLHGAVAYDWYSGSTPSAANHHADEFLAWRGMLLAKERNAATFDFGGAGLPGEDYGPREFKRRFGGRETNLGRYTKVLRPARLKVAARAARVLRRLG